MKTQIQNVLEHLISGRSITALEALQNYGVMHLPRRIMDLEELGHVIIRKTISVVKANGRIAHVTQYSMAEIDQDLF